MKPSSILKIYVLTFVILNSQTTFSEDNFIKAFDELPASIKKSGKKLKLSLYPASSVDIVVHISQWVPFPAGSHKLMTQKVIISGSTESITIDIPQTPQSKDSNNVNLNRLLFWICPLKVSEYLDQPVATRKPYNFNNELDRPGQPANGGVRLMQALATTLEYSYDKLPKHIVLPNPTEILHDLVGCSC